MKITSISYGKTFNTGNYTSDRIEVTASVDDNEQEAIYDIKNQLKIIVEEMHK